ncbi:hypothetical protein BDD12DRAFT_889317 [Trichophaea hybrida]|nr:hypothetical protein BDD12DRAFT_889317 [Trichophaea hybrida]
MNNSHPTTADSGSVDHTDASTLVQPDVHQAGLDEVASVVPSLPVRPIGNEAVEKAVKEVLLSLPSEFILQPRSGETFVSIETVVRRLQATSSTPEKIRYKCVHHAKAPRNTRSLTDHPVSKDVFQQQGGKDSNGQILRQREGKFRGKDCKFEVYIIRKAVRGTGTREVHWTMGVTRLLHTHPALANPFVYPEHERIHPRFSELYEEAMRHRHAGLSFHQHTAIAAESLIPVQRQRYNHMGLVVRNEGESAATVIDRLFILLKEKKYFIRPRWSEQTLPSPSGPIAVRQLEQLLFCN